MRRGTIHVSSGEMAWITFRLLNYLDERISQFHAITPAAYVLYKQACSHSPSSESYPVLGRSRNSPHFMESEGSLPHSQVPSICPCPEPDQSSSCLPSYFLKIHLNLLAPELFFLILAHPVYKMWIIQEPNTLRLWNKLYFEGKKRRVYTMFKIFSTYNCWINIYFFNFSTPVYKMWIQEPNTLQLWNKLHFE